MKKTIYVLGNPLLEKDSLPLKIYRVLEKKFPEIDFVLFDPNEDSEVADKPIFMDSVTGIKKTKIFNDLKHFEISPRNSVHDFDLHVFLGLMLKLKKISSFKIIGIPSKLFEKKALQEVTKILKSI